MNKFAQELASPDTPARGYRADAADAAALQAALHSAVRGLGAPEVLVYNAALLGHDTPTDLDADHLAHTLAVNVIGAVAAAQTVLPLLDGGHGSLLFTGGALALNPSPERASLAMGKAALRNYVQALHKQQHGTDVQVTTVTIAGYIGGGDPRFAPATIAAAYLDLHHQPRDQWQAELLYS